MAWHRARGRVKITGLRNGSILWPARISIKTATHIASRIACARISGSTAAGERAYRGNIKSTFFVARSAQHAAHAYDINARGGMRNMHRRAASLRHMAAWLTRSLGINARQA